MPNGKAKGSEFERHISKLLSKWWSKNERDDLFWRTSNSGGRFTVRRRKGVDTHHQIGDICDIHPDGKLFCDLFCVECKNYKIVDLWSIVNGSGLIIDWWKKLQEVCNSEGKHPILIVKANNKPILYFTDDNVSSLLASFYGSVPVFVFWIGSVQIFTFKFAELISLDPDRFKSLCQSLIERQHCGSSCEASPVCDTQA